jgi:hypothetical protein
VKTKNPVFYFLNNLAEKEDENYGKAISPAFLTHLN